MKFDVRERYEVANDSFNVYFCDLRSSFLIVRERSFERAFRNLEFRQRTPRSYRNSTFEFLFCGYYATEKCSFYCLYSCSSYFFFLLLLLNTQYINLLL